VPGHVAADRGQAASRRLEVGGSEALPPSPAAGTRLGMQKALARSSHPFRSSSLTLPSRRTASPRP
jgi:hypothetical protein